MAFDYRQFKTVFEQRQKGGEYISNCNTQKNQVIKWRRWLKRRKAELPTEV